MATATQQRKLKTLFEQSMERGGHREFRRAMHESFGIRTRERLAVSPDSQGAGARFEQYYDRESDLFRDDHRSEQGADGAWQIGEVMSSLCGPNWRSIDFETFATAGQRRFEGVGGSIVGAETPYVSAALDVIAGLMNARALQRAALPEWIWDRVVDVQQATGEGGFHIGKRVDPSDQDQGAETDMGESQTPPIVKLIQTRIHRNRTHYMRRRVKVGYWQVRDDLTGQVMETVDEAGSLPVLRERERKVADCVMGVSSGTTLSTSQTFDTQGYAPCMVQDGLTFFPWHQGYFGSNAGTGVVAQENGVAIADYGNNGSGGANGGDGAGLTDYTALVRAMQYLVANRDPFTKLPPNITFRGMQFILLTPAAEVQLKFLLEAEQLWQILNAVSPPAMAFTTSNSRYNLVRDFGLQLLTSQFWGNRATDIGLAYQPSGNAISTISQQKLTFTPGTDTYATSGSIMSAFLMGHFRESLIYWQRQPYTAMGVPLSSIEVGEQVVIVQDHLEQGEPFWNNPRQVYRTWA